MFFSKKLQQFNNLRHCFFSRKNGFSKGYYQSLNCGLGSSDKKENIIKNLNFVSQKIGCKAESLITLRQSHSNKVLYFENKNSLENKLHGDAIVTKIKNVAIGILTADCAPVLFYDQSKKIIGCVHSGWKGALNGIISNTIKKFNDLGSDNKDIIAVVGPCIEKVSYEVKAEFCKKFIEQNKKNKEFFEKKNKDKLLFDLRGYINKQITNSSIANIENIKMDTFSDKENFYSYRRACLNGEKDYGRCISVILMT